MAGTKISEPQGYQCDLFVPCKSSLVCNWLPAVHVLNRNKYEGAHFSVILPVLLCFSFRSKLAFLGKRSGTGKNNGILLFAKNPAHYDGKCCFNFSDSPCTGLRQSSSSGLGSRGLYRYVRF